MGPTGYRWRAVRGGSWNNDMDNARVAVRNNNHPHNDWNNNGFRVVAAHASLPGKTCQVSHRALDMKRYLERPDRSDP
jgi:hypothetical protein